jgi:hypothetical protein
MSSDLKFLKLYKLKAFIRTKIFVGKERVLSKDTSFKHFDVIRSNLSPNK